MSRWHRAAGVTVTQYDMDIIAQLGLLKFDFLGLRYLTVISDAEKMIQRTMPDFSVEKIPLDDEKTYLLIERGNTAGVFQLESAGMRRVLGGMQPRDLEGIVAAIALYRPGPMESIRSISTTASIRKIFPIPFRRSNPFWTSRMAVSFTRNKSCRSVTR